MTLQFRSRTRSIYDYGSDLKTTGKCCFSDGTSQNYTFVECFTKGGNFFPDETITCPDQGKKGYCCSCLYTSESTRDLFVANSTVALTNSLFNISDGIVDNVTECECSRIGGRWSETLPNPISSLCRKTVSINGSNVTVDVRFPSACCHPYYGITFISGVTCSNVCTARQCANLVEAESGAGDPYLDSVFNQYKLCDKTFNNNGVVLQCSNANTLSFMSQGNAVFADQNYGACFSLSSNGINYEYSCTIVPEFSCTEYWIPPDPETNAFSYCDHKFAPKTPTKTSGRIDPIKYTESEFNSLGLSVGDEFQGGIFIGIFKPSKPNSTNTSNVYGSLNFSTPISTTVSVTDESPYSRWAIVVNKNSINTNLFSVDESITPIVNFTSYYDGYMNFYGENSITPGLNTIASNSIRGINRGGFVDYYVPSIVEMMFFAEQLRNNEILRNTFNFMNNYFSSTIFTDRYSTQNFSNQSNFNGNYFTYGLDFQSENLGKTIITNINTTVNMMLFRRIVII
jgi:hypothetical protein